MHSDLFILFFYYNWLVTTLFAQGCRVFMTNLTFFFTAVHCKVFPRIVFFSRIKILIEENVPITAIILSVPWSGLPTVTYPLITSLISFHSWVVTHSFWILCSMVLLISLSIGWLFWFKIKANVVRKLRSHIFELLILWIAFWFVTLSYVMVPRSTSSTADFRLLFGSPIA